MAVSYQNGGSGWNLVGGAALGGFIGDVAGAAVGGFIGAAAPAIGSFLTSAFSFGVLSFTMSGGALAWGVTTISVTGAQIASADAGNKTDITLTTQHIQLLNKLGVEFSISFC